jgi:hypothetical protein
MENFYDIMMAISVFAVVCVWLLICVYVSHCVLEGLIYNFYRQIKSREIPDYEDYEDYEDDEAPPKRIRYISPLQSYRIKK